MTRARTCEFRCCIPVQYMIISTRSIELIMGYLQKIICTGYRLATTEYGYRLYRAQCILDRAVRSVGVGWNARLRVWRLGCHRSRAESTRRVLQRAGEGSRVRGTSAARALCAIHGSRTTCSASRTGPARNINYIAKRLSTWKIILRWICKWGKNNLIQRGKLAQLEKCQDS